MEKKSSSWLKETPMHSPRSRNITEPPPQTVHHYYTPPPQNNPVIVQNHSSKPSLWYVGFWILCGILLMYTIHCVYTIPDALVWKDYISLRTYVSNLQI